MWYLFVWYLFDICGHCLDLWQCKQSIDVDRSSGVCSHQSTPPLLSSSTASELKPLWSSESSCTTAELSWTELLNTTFSHQSAQPLFTTSCDRRLLAQNATKDFKNILEYSDVFEYSENLRCVTKSSKLSYEGLRAIWANGPPPEWGLVGCISYLLFRNCKPKMSHF